MSKPTHLLKTPNITACGILLSTYRRGEPVRRVLCLTEDLDKVECLRCLKWMEDPWETRLGRNPTVSFTRAAKKVLGIDTIL